MNHRRRSIAAGMMIAVLATGLLQAGDAWGIESSEVQEMRRELAQMRAQVQALQNVVAEATELERQRSATLTRAMKDFASTVALPAAPAPAAPPPAAPAPGNDAPAEARQPTTPAASADKKSRAKSRQRRHRRSGRARSKALRALAADSDR